MMDPTAIALTGFIALLVLLFLRMAVGTALLLVGTLGILALRPQAAVPVVAGEIFTVASNPALIILPLFILMGALATVSGMSKDMFNAAQSWFGHIRGGLASATVVACAGFSALSGSSLASALTMGQVALPEMKRLKYSDSLATGTVAAGGALGILIPPSSGFIIYAVLTEQSVGRLFMAGILPGLMLALLFIVAIWLVVMRHPESSPKPQERAPIGQRLQELQRAGWILGIIVITIGGIYGGVFSATEAAAFGAFLTLIVTVLRKEMTIKNLTKIGQMTLGPTGTVFYILFGAFVFKTFLGLTGAPFLVSNWVESLGFSGVQIVLLVLLTAIILGTVLEGLAILVLVLPLAQPILENAGVDMIWFGVLMVITLEMALISPPVGINVFVVKSIVPDVPMRVIFKGIWPFWLAMMVAAIIVFIVPDIALLLPNTMFD